VMSLQEALRSCSSISYSTYFKKGEISFIRSAEKHLVSNGWQKVIRKVSSSKLPYTSFVKKKACRAAEGEAAKSEESNR